MIGFLFCLDFIFMIHNVYAGEPQVPCENLVGRVVNLNRVLWKGTFTKVEDFQSSVIINCVPNASGSPSITVFCLDFDGIVTLPWQEGLQVQGYADVKSGFNVEEPREPIPVVSMRDEIKVNNIAVFTHSDGSQYAGRIKEFSTFHVLQVEIDDSDETHYRVLNKVVTIKSKPGYPYVNLNKATPVFVMDPKEIKKYGAK